MNLYLFTSWVQGEALVDFFWRASADGQFQAHGRALEAHYRFLAKTIGDRIEIQRGA